ncbi:MAG TPA: hypothetical protein VEA81_19305 [Burkholderiaceae bacterium]|nr:hypothetical protein [Burkholderiaceae bacterium]
MPELTVQLTERQYEELKRRAARQSVFDPAMLAEEQLAAWLNRPERLAPGVPASGVPIRLTGRSFEADAIHEPDGRCTVLKGTRAARRPSASFARVRAYVELRGRLIAEGDLAPAGGGSLAFARDTTLPSVAAATAIITGYAGEGPDRWAIRGAEPSMTLGEWLASAPGGPG